MLEHRRDIASDMSVFHRVDVEEVEQMPAARYFMLAVRLPAYSGAVTARLRAASEETAAPAAQPAAQPAPVSAAETPARADRTGVRTGPHPGSSWSFATAGGDA